MPGKIHTYSIANKLNYDTILPLYNPSQNSNNNHTVKATVDVIVAGSLSSTAYSTLESTVNTKLKYNDNMGNIFPQIGISSGNTFIGDNTINILTPGISMSKFQPITNKTWIYDHYITIFKNDYTKVYSFDITICYFNVSMSLFLSGNKYYYNTEFHYSSNTFVSNYDANNVIWCTVIDSSANVIFDENTTNKIGIQLNATSFDIVVQFNDSNSTYTYNIRTEKKLLGSFY